MSNRDYLKKINSIDLSNIELLKKRYQQLANQQEGANADGTAGNITSANLLTDFEKAIKLVDIDKDVDYQSELINLLFPFLRDNQATTNIVESLPQNLQQVLVINFSSFVVPKLRELEGQRITKPAFKNVLLYIGNKLLNKVSNVLHDPKQQQTLNQDNEEGSKHQQTNQNEDNEEGSKQTEPVLSPEEIYDIKSKIYEYKYFTFLHPYDTQQRKNSYLQYLVDCFKSLPSMFGSYDDWINVINQNRRSLLRLNDVQFVDIIIMQMNKAKEINNNELNETVIKEIFGEFNKESLINICGYLNNLIEDKVDELEKQISKYTENEGNAGNEEQSQEDEEGEGLLKKKILGTGLKSKHEHHINNKKYFINMKKLNNNVLEIRYSSNRHLIPIKSQYISSNVKACIMDAMKKHTIDPQIFQKLTSVEKNLIRSLLKYFDIDDELDNDEAFNKRFEVIRGEILAGNNNIALKKEAKEYLLHAMNTSKISRQNYINAIQELGI